MLRAPTSVGLRASVGVAIATPRHHCVRGYVARAESGTPDHRERARQRFDYWHSVCPCVLVRGARAPRSEALTGAGT